MIFILFILMLFVVILLNVLRPYNTAFAKAVNSFSM
ncbi:hypothetical protein Metho_1934 [Methanomethylovorans hollandica DSM 15978]|uniref:Uncharacterized protein n=1 Tax=Methanomethylovorans hollandica (strain DSM 15978 / NBRC 107637 / DMS1) TaxID=867904 RepID=L0L1F3_METHD|nr:hypothetical protein Metho_1934 [Methanomethylovorans hollandica DSM 15978]